MKKQPLKSRRKMKSINDKLNGGAKIKKSGFTPCVMLALLLLPILNSQLSTALAQGTAFTYQGRLNDGGTVANGSYDLRFIIYDNSVGGNQQGPILTNSATAVSNGLFTVTIDFGNQFPGANRWLDIGVRTNGTGAFTTLNTRQLFTATPYAITAGNVTSGGLAAGTYGSAVTFSNAANSFSGSGAGLINVNATTIGGLASSNIWQTAGNTVSVGRFLGSVNNQPLDFQANNLRVMEFAYASNSASGYSPNVIGGNSANNVSAGVVGATIGGGGGFLGFPNSVTADFGTVVGGTWCSANGKYAIAGGYRSTASGNSSTALGSSTATNGASTAMGQSFAGGSSSTAMGQSTATGDSSTAMGFSRAYGNNSTAMGDATASGDSSTAMGIATANGFASFAAGYAAYANNDNTFVWSDGNMPPYPGVFSSTAPDQFLIHATGGVGIGLTNPAAALHVASAGVPQVQITQNNTSDGCRLRMNVSGNPFWEMQVTSDASAPQLQFWLSNQSGPRMYVTSSGDLYAASFNITSDRNAKENFSGVSPQEVLNKVAALPITRWNFKQDKEVEHLGPMAQDFRAAFGLGTDDRHIATVDEEGVALAAIQGLNQKLEQKLEQKETEITELKQNVAELKNMMQMLAEKK